MSKRILYILIMLPSLAFFACGQNQNSPMGNWGHMMGHGYYGGFMWLFFLFFSGIIIYFVFQASRSKGSHDSIMETPLDILERRYATGEIEKDEFERKKKDLE